MGSWQFRLARSSWERLARRDPLWAVLTDPRKRDGRWDPDEFFATGDREIASVFEHLESQGIAIEDRSQALDFGCGVGRLTRALASRFDEVHGVDASPTMIRRASELNATVAGMLRFILNTEPDLAQLTTARYSFVYSSIVLQHIPYPVSLGYVRELMRVARPGGLIVFQTPTLDRTGLVRRTVRAAARKVVQIGRLPIPALEMEMHAIPESEIVRAAAAGGCDRLDVISTNSAASDSNGALQLYRDDRGERLVSKLFVLRKR